jgi:hypothetical protein
MSASSAHSLSGGCGTFWGNRLTFAAKGLAKMGVGCAILLEMKISSDCYTLMTSGYKVLLTKAPSKHQGGIALLWQPEHAGFEVEATKIMTPNLITFRLVTGDERYYVMGMYIPPNDTGGGDDLRAAWEACPTSISTLNTPDEREAAIADLLDEINLVDTSQNSHFGSAACRRHGNNAPGVINGRTPNL